MIRAECHSDDHVVEVAFDATIWFEQASDKEILDLAAVEWGGDYPADDVAIWMADRNGDIARMFTYLEMVAGRRNSPGFECHIDGMDAMGWLGEHRPHLVAKIEAGDFEDRPRPSPKEWRPRR